MNETTITCARCKSENRFGSNFCARCGRELAKPVGVAAQAVPSRQTGIRPSDFPEDITMPAGDQSAGFWRRFCAYLVDSLILNVFSIVLFVVFGLLVYLTVQLFGDNDSSKVIGVGLVVFGYVVFILGYWLYFARFECSAKKATPGKLALHLAVVNKDGQGLSFGKASLRFLVKNLLFFGVVTILFSKQRKTLHDMITGTSVVKAR